MAATAGGAVPAANALEFLRIVGKLKRTKRSGWVHRGVEEPESVADHSYRMAMCSFLCQGGGYDTTRVLKIAVVHDLAESLVGDLAPHHGVSKEEKARLEQAAMERICGTIGDAGIAEEILGHFRDYEERGSPEAQLVAEIDKFEMILQADEYEREQGTLLQDFFDSTQGKIKTPLVASWASELRRQREERLAADAAAEGGGAST